MLTPQAIADRLLEAGSFDYANTDLKLPPEIADFLISWGKLNIPDDALFIGEDGGKGRELDAHITIKYGLLVDTVPPELREIAKATQPFSVYMGQVSLFTTNPEFDVVKVEIESPELHELNRRIAAQIASKDTHPKYNPHATIAYVVKGTCDHLEGADPFASPEIGREFVAAGMNFSGHGEDDDPNRVKETLLFSRTKKQEVAEAVLQPSEADVSQIIKIIADTARLALGNVEVFRAHANAALAELGVRFIDRADAMQNGQLSACADEHGIALPLPSQYDLKDPDWPGSLTAAIHHEAVHMMQLDAATDPKEASDSATRYVLAGGQLDSDRYLQQKQEVMAYAASMVREWKARGYSKQEMLLKLRSGQWNHGIKYWQARHRLPATFQRYCKQAAEYINQP